MNLLNLFALVPTVFSIALAAQSNSQAIDLQNAQDAAILNAEYLGLKATDPCDSGQLGCIDGNSAKCQYGSWQVTRCPAPTSCFALPLLNNITRGTTIKCANQSDVELLYLANNFGVPIVANSHRTVAFPTETPSANQTNPSAPSASDAVGVATVTVTVIIPPTSFFTTLPAQVTTISPEEALKIIASALANGAAQATASATPQAEADVLAASPSVQSSTVHCTMTRSRSVPSSSIPTPSGMHRVRRH